MELEEEEGQVCRLCGQCENIFIDVFGEEGTKRLLGVKIQTKVNILVRENDGLPRAVCMRCIGTLEFVCDFYERCQLTQRMLQARKNSVATTTSPEPGPEVDGESDKENASPPVTLTSNPPKKRSLKRTLSVGNSRRVRAARNGVVSECEVKRTPLVESNNRKIEDSTPRTRGGAESERKEDEGASTTTLEPLGALKEEADPPGVVVSEEKGQKEPRKLPSSSSPLVGDEAESLERVAALEGGAAATEGEKSGLDRDSDDLKAAPRRGAKIEERKRLRKYRKVSELISPEQKEAIEELYYVDMSRVKGEEVMRHLTLVEGKSSRCNLCGLIYSRTDKCQVHIWGHLKMRPFCCKSCNFATVTVSNIRCHIRKSHLKIKPFQCQLCEKRYVTAALLEEHLNTHTGAKPHRCQHCDFSSASRQALTYHAATHKPTKDVICNICGKEFFSKDRMRAHMLVHNKDKVFSCKLCSAYLCNERALEKHYKNVHTRDYVCKICGKATKSRKALHNHQNVHSAAKYKCPQCPRVYKSSHILKEHLLKHEGIRKYKCDVCEKSFAQQSHLAAHMAVHSEIRFNCPGCQRGFNRHDNMKMHTKRCQAFLANPELKDLLKRKERVKRTSGAGRYASFDRTVLDEQESGKPGEHGSSSSPTTETMTLTMTKVAKTDSETDKTESENSNDLETTPNGEERDSDSDSDDDNYDKVNGNDNHGEFGENDESYGSVENETTGCNDELTLVENILGPECF